MTRMLWDECAAVGMPRAVVVTKLDHQRADFEATLAACREAFGDGVVPLYLPVGDDGRRRADRAALAEAVRLLRRRARRGRARGRRRRSAWPTCAAS